MARKCIYCRSEVADDSVIDFCESCGVRVWGHKMFNAIRSEMEASKKRGDLEQGNVE